MHKKHLHIVALNIPYPADYGGIIDIFYKVKALHEQGVGIILHCFEYGRERSAELEKYCKKVHYYRRKSGLAHFLNKKPYIVKTRSDKRLLDNLKNDDFPVLFEGLHTTYFISHKALSDRKKLIRSHNIEHEYYARLASAEKNWFEKMYLSSEAVKLRNYYQIHNYADHILAISKSDQQKLGHHFTGVEYIPAFHPNTEVQVNTSKSDYILFHGNLSVAENTNALNYLLDNVLSRLEHKVIIAGRNPSNRLKNKLNKFGNVQLIASPDDKHLDSLIKNAQINLLFTFQSTGLKLKLLNALYKGKFCLVNTTMVEKTGLEELCVIRDNPQDMIREIHTLFNRSFNTELIQKRKKILENEFSNRNNAKKIIEMI